MRYSSPQDRSRTGCAPPRRARGLPAFGWRPAPAIVPVVVMVVAMAVATATVGAQELPEPRGFVNDFAGVVDGESEREMTQLAEAVREATDAEIAVAVVESIESYGTVDEYSIRLAEEWGVGGEEDTGALFVVAIEEREVRLEIGYGLEGPIPDGRAGEILDSAVVPALRQDEYGRGLLAGMQEVAGIIAEEYEVDLSEYGAQAPRATETARDSGGGGRFLYILLFMFLFGGRFFWPLLFLGGGRGFFGGGFGAGRAGGGGFGGGGFGGGGASRGF